MWCRWSVWLLVLAILLILVLVLWLFSDIRATTRTLASLWPVVARVALTVLVLGTLVLVTLVLVTLVHKVARRRVLVIVMLVVGCSIETLVLWMGVVVVSIHLLEIRHPKMWVVAAWHIIFLAVIVGVP